MKDRAVKSKDLIEDIDFVDSVRDQVLKMKDKYLYSRLLMDKCHIAQTSAWKALYKLQQEGELEDMGLKIIRGKDGSRNRMRMFRRI